MDGSPSASAYVSAEHYDPVADSYAALIAEGLDEQDPEALEYAAEVMQIDARLSTFTNELLKLDTPVLVGRRAMGRIVER